MLITRITNRGRIAPSSPQVPSGSERNSFSTASIVSTIETQSPEPKLEEESTNKGQETLATSSAKSKVVIVSIIVVCSLVVMGIVLAIVLPLTLKKSSNTAPLVTNSVNMSSTTTVR